MYSGAGERLLLCSAHQVALVVVFTADFVCEKKRICP